MHICVVTETYWPEVNGVAMTLHRWVNGLIERGHTVQIVAPAHPERHSSLDVGVSHHAVMSVPMPGYPGVRIGLPARKIIERLWTKQLPDVVYVATEGPLGSSAITVANQYRIRLVSGYHTNFHSYAKHYWFSFLSPWVERSLVRIHNKTTCTIVPTTWQQDMLRNMGIHNVAVVGRGVDTQLFTPAARSERLRQQWGAGKDDLVMILVGRVAEEKNLDLTLAAFERMREKAPALKFVMVGDGPARSRISKQYPEIIMAGVRTGKDLAAHYASADVFVFSSKTETFGNVVLEAMASGLGLVAFDYAAASQHVRDGETGLVAPLDNNDTLIAAASRLVSNPALLKRLRTGAANHAEGQNWVSVISDLEQLLAGEQAFSVATEPDPVGAHKTSQVA